MAPDRRALVPHTVLLFIIMCILIIFLLCVCPVMTSFNEIVLLVLLFIMPPAQQSCKGEYTGIRPDV